MLKLVLLAVLVIACVFTYASAQGFGGGQGGGLDFLQLFFLMRQLQGGGEGFSIWTLLPFLLGGGGGMGSLFGGMGGMGGAAAAAGGF